MDQCQRLHFSTVDIQPSNIRHFGERLLDQVRKLEWGAHAYFVHQFRGTKGATARLVGTDDAIANDPFRDLNEAAIRADPNDWYCDVGIELRKKGHVLQLRPDGHLSALQHLFTTVSEDALRRAMGSAKFKRDLVAQIEGLAGFRYTPSPTIQEQSGIVYAQGYTTDKCATYQLHDGIFAHMNASRFYPQQIRHLLKRLVGMEDLYLRCGGEVIRGAMVIPSLSDDEDTDLNTQEGSVRLEVRVEFSRMDRVLESFPQELIDHAVLAFKPAVFWYVFSTLN